MSELLLFLAKTSIIVVAVAIIIGIAAAAMRRRQSGGGRLTIRRLNESLERLKQAMLAEMLPASELKAHVKAEKARRKAASEEQRPNLYVLDFDGDILANQVKTLRQAVTAVLSVAREGDEVVVRIESPGGVVPGYGLGASQLARLRSKGLKVTACVDKIAASGGYMMAVESDQILAAPFAIVGSIGVVAQIPNAHRFLEKHGIDYHEVTAGKYKRTLSVFGKPTPEGEQKLQEQLEDTHELFKGHVAQTRPQLDIEQVSTGEYWYGKQAITLGLVDRLVTSDDYILERLNDTYAYLVKFEEAQPIRRMFSGAAAAVLDRVLLRWLSRAEASRYV